MPQIDVGTGYGRKPPVHDASMTEVGPGTPMGELLRRYWHPVGLCSDASATPKAIRVSRPTSESALKINLLASTSSGS